MVSPCLSPRPHYPSRPEADGAAYKFRGDVLRAIVFQTHLEAKYTAKQSVFFFVISSANTYSYATILRKKKQLFCSLEVKRIQSVP